MGPIIAAAGVFGISANVTTHFFPFTSRPWSSSLHRAAASAVANSTAQHPLLFPVALSAKNVNDLTRPNSPSTPSNSASVVHHVSDATYTAVGRPSSGAFGDAVRTGALALTGARVGALAALALAAVVFTGASSSARTRSSAVHRARIIVSHPRIRSRRRPSSRVVASRASKSDPHDSMRASNSPRSSSSSSRTHRRRRTEAPPRPRHRSPPSCRLARVDVCGKGRERVKCNLRRG